MIEFNTGDIVETFNKFNGNHKFLLKNSGVRLGNKIFYVKDLNGNWEYSTVYLSTLDEYFKVVKHTKLGKILYK